MAKEVKQWITVKGRHIPIFEGETAKDAIKRMADKGKTNSPTSKETKQKGINKAKNIKNKADRDYKKNPTALNAENKTIADERHEQAKNRPELKSAHFKKKESNNKPTQADKEKYIKEHGLDKYVRELNSNSTERGAKAAIDYVYDQHTLSKEQFKKKYFKDDKQSGKNDNPYGKIKSNIPVSKDKGDAHDQAMVDTIGKLREKGQATTNVKSVADMYAKNKNFSVFQDYEDSSVWHIQDNNKMEEMFKKEHGGKSFSEVMSSQYSVRAKYGLDKKESPKLVKATPEIQKAAEQEAQKTKDAYVKENGITGAKGANQLREKINNTGWKIDAADMHSIERGNLNTDDKVTLWDTNGKEYEATYNRYRDGGIELVSVTPKKKEDFVVDYDIQSALDKKEAKRAKSREAYAKKKQANMEAAKKALQAGEDTPKTQAEAKALKEKYERKYYTESQLKDSEFRESALAEMKRYERNWSFYSAKERRNISPNGVGELRKRIKEIENYNSKVHTKKIADRKVAGKQAIKDAKEAIKSYGPKRDMIQDVKKYDAAWTKVSSQFARGEISQEDYTTIYHMFGSRFHEGYKVRHRKK